jgi:putative flippase GtrA
MICGRPKIKWPGADVFRRFAKFSVVGASGIVVQTLALGALLRFSDINYMLATAVAVELSVLHNFVWHRRWTWADRPTSRGVLVLLRFNATNGAMSLAGNLIFMFLLVGGLGLDPRAANLIAIGFCSLVNFALADCVVFV